MVRASAQMPAIETIRSQGAGCCSCSPMESVVAGPTLVQLGDVGVSAFRVEAVEPDGAGDAFTAAIMAPIALRLGVGSPLLRRCAICRCRGGTGDNASRSLGCVAR